MENIILVYKIVAVCYLAMSIGAISGQYNLEKIYTNLIKDQGFLMWGGCFGVIIGFVLLHVHNDWVLDWPVIVTLLGWAALIKGVAILAFPNHLTFYKPIFAGGIAKALTFILLIFGLLMAYLGFLA